MGPLWYDRAVDDLEKRYERGDIDSDQFQFEMRDLNAELRDAADQAADDARESFYN